MNEADRHIAGQLIDVNPSNPENVADRVVFVRRHVALLVHHADEAAEIVVEIADLSGGLGMKRGEARRAQSQNEGKREKKSPDSDTWEGAPTTQHTVSKNLASER
jgi:hypothetical protein